MKKILLIVIIFLFPLIVQAYGIENYYINATVLDNGDLEVQEYFNLTGSYNGMEREILYRNTNAPTFNPDMDSYGGSSLHNGSGIVINEVRAVELNDNFNFSDVDGEIFNSVYSASKGDYGVYTVSNTYGESFDSGKLIRIFLPNYKNKAFYIKYVLKDMAILHNDVAEFGWNVVGNNLSESVENLVVTVNIPNNKNEIGVWGHGPLEGNTEIVDKNTIIEKIKYLNSKTAIDVRVVFDKEVIINSNKKSNVSALDKIVKYETSEAEKANYERQVKINDTIDEIEQSFKRLDETTSRAIYNDLFYLIYSVPDGDDKTKLFSKLVTYNDKVDSYEYGVFQDYLLLSLKNFDYYKKANDIINNVFNSELKDKMRNELVSTKKKIINNEWKKEWKIVLVSIVTIVVPLILYRFLLYKKKKMKSNTEPLYVREIPSNLAPECVGLITDSTINGNEITAAILDLIKRKIITFEKKDNGSYDLKFNYTSDKVTAYDRVLARLIFQNKTIVNSKKIKKIKYDDFSKWKKQTIKQLEDKELINHYDMNKEKVNGDLLIYSLFFLPTPVFFVTLVLLFVYLIKKYRSKLFIKFLVYINVLLIFVSLISNHFVHVSIIGCIISIIIVEIIIRKLPLKIRIKKTEKGIHEAASWNGLRNFLIDFSAIEEREIPELALWEDYLIYATAFGIGKEVLNAMKVKIEAEHIDMEMIEKYTIFNSISDVSRIAKSISNISSNKIPVAYAKTYTSRGGIGGGYSGGSFSSGSGSGGGFSGGSSGGGSFGGGGGGGRF